MRMHAQPRVEGLRDEVLHKLATGGMAEIYVARATGPAGFAEHVGLRALAQRAMARA